MERISYLFWLYARPAGAILNQLIFMQKSLTSGHRVTADGCSSDFRSGWNSAHSEGRKESPDVNRYKRAQHRIISASNGAVSPKLRRPPVPDRPSVLICVNRPAAAAGTVTSAQMATNSNTSGPCSGIFPIAETQTRLFYLFESPNIFIVDKSKRSKIPPKSAD